MKTKHLFILASVITLLSCSEKPSKEINDTTANTPDCCKELEQVKIELHTTQLKLELLRLQLMVMEDSMARISQKQ